MSGIMHTFFGLGYYGYEVEHSKEIGDFKLVCVMCNVVIIFNVYI